ncbi:NAD(P)/FAD-dependent oxidoreductase [Aeoliella sp.]|uniref:NAD(P)/FAD-dependent oxidoreductase n=1 Tax=Aeoliella sp. TaxID=2795800 RepID=UPI003CCB8BAA
MRIAVIGLGVSGCVAARLLATRHDVVLYDSNPNPGGHALTVDVDRHGQRVAVDVGFMVFNTRTYPNFCRMLDMLGVASRASDMSFSVRDPQRDFEYQGSGLRGLFAKRANALSPSFWRMIGDILRFNQGGCNAVRLGLPANQSVGEFLQAGRFSPGFVHDYLVPMAAAIWSTRPSDVFDYPAKFLIGFFANHGLLQLRNRPQWRTIVGGSRRYVEPLLADLRDRLHLADPVARVRRGPAGFKVETLCGDVGEFDEVVFACHADQTLRIFPDATDDEADTLTAFPYQPNQAVLHTDQSRLPARRDAWASWNYCLSADRTTPATVTYDLGRLQGVVEPGELLLSLNETEQIDRQKVLKTFEFSHPAYTMQSIAAQSRWATISGRAGAHFCGAYWGYGFHEDGVNSALRVAKQFGIGLEACTAACTKEPSPTTVAIR